MTLLGAPGLRPLLASQVVSAVGSQMTFLALPWFAAFGAALTLPVFALAVEMPIPAVVAALALSSFFGPLVNAPLIGVITMRTPEAVRARVMTGVITLAVLAGPAGMSSREPLLERWGARPVFLLVAAGQLLAVIPFVVAAFRPSALPEPARSSLADS